MNITIERAPLCGSVAAIASKSDVHRLLICAALAEAPTHVTCPEHSEDILATVRCLQALGAEIFPTPVGFDVLPVHSPAQNPLLDCGESGSTLRFLLPVAAALGGGARFTGKGRLAERPLAPLCTALEAHGCTLSPVGVFPLRCGGKLQGGTFFLPADISSQFITGLLLALPLTPEGGEIRLQGKLESAPYVAMTMDALARFQISVYTTRSGFRVPGGQTFRSPGDVEADGDWSNAAFWLCAGALGFGVECRNLRSDSLQGDRQVLDILGRFGAATGMSGSAVRVDGGHLKGIQLDASQIPDLVPVLSVVAAAAQGETVIYNAARLRLKESDRLAATANLLRALGAAAEETPDGLRIQGGNRLTGGQVDSCGDHRIAMAAAVAAMLCDGPVTILGAEAVNKSYPDFFRDYAALGGVCTVEKEA